MPSVFITGVSSGIGLGPVLKYLSSGFKVYGISRRPCPEVHENLKAVEADIIDTPNVPGKLFELLGGVKELDLVVLNAGVLGKIAHMKDVSLSEMKEVMDINLWGNKTVLDWLFKHVPTVKQVVAISSGAAVNGNKGWNAYSLSKAALNMMVKLYAVEQTETHFMSFAPGLVDTAMQDYLCSLDEAEEYPSLGRIKACRGTENMPAPDELAERLPAVFDKLHSYESGSFIDIRKM